MALTDNKKIYSNEHPIAKVRNQSVTDNLKVADISGKDINASKMKGYSAVNLETAKELSMNPTLTEAELTNLKKAVKDKKKLEPTGQFKKD
jgi:rhamnose utilization protein RhaD (predicted bifunctional aldolase and dehydrogenase)